jgi:hypothetical protein
MLKKCLSPLLLLFVTHSLMADELIIGVGQQGQSALQTAKPERGMTMEQVGQAYGEPVRIDGPTGNPSIETWHYEYFSVYFEGDTVIHSVIKHIRQDQQGDTPQ